jgi:hypothetical protein
MQSNETKRIRTALLKKPLLSLFAYEVSCRVRVEKTTHVNSTKKKQHSPQKLGSPAPELDSALYGIYAS